MLSSTFYYFLKPLIPRGAQIALRRQVVRKKLPSCANVWPIDERAATPPPGWRGWPEGKKFAFVITHDVETARGHERAYRLAKLDRELGFRSSFNFVPEGYKVSDVLRRELVKYGFEVGVHGLTHRAQLFTSKDKFSRDVDRIKHYLKEWDAVGFRTPSMYHNLDWYHDLELEYDASTFDTDPFEPQSDGAGTIFPFWVPRGSGDGGYVELPYTLPQDFMLYVLMGERNTEIWKSKLDWIARNGGMALLLVHPDYIRFDGKRRRSDEYPVAYYREFLEYVESEYKDQYWQALPRDVARFWAKSHREEAAPRALSGQSIPDMLSTRRGAKKRACVISYSFYEVDFRVSRYVDALVREGYSVDVFALRRKGQSRRDTLNGVNIYHLQERDYNEKGPESFFVRMVLFYGKVFFVVLAKQLQYRYKVVHFHNPPDFLVFSAVVPKILGAKIIFDMHENLPEFYCAKFNKSQTAFLVKGLLFFEKIAIQFADFTIVAHDLLRERVIKRDGIPREKCVALLNYPPRTFLEPAPRKKDEEEFRVIYPGTISHQHGIDIAIKAMAIVKQECKSARLDIYGAARSPVYYQELIKLTEDLGLNGTVSFPGVVPFEEMQKILLGASIGVVPKRGGIFGSEAFSTKILEFMAAGLPVILSKTKIDEYYFDGSMVMFFEPENHIDLARCIVELYRNPEKRQALAKTGSTFIEKNNWEIKSQLYLDIVAGLVGTTKDQARKPKI